MRSGAQLDQREIPRDPIVLRSAARDSPSHVIHDTYTTACQPPGCSLARRARSRASGDRLLIISRGVPGCAGHRYALPDSSIYVRPRLIGTETLWLLQSRLLRPRNKRGCRTSMAHILSSLLPLKAPPKVACELSDWLQVTFGVTSGDAFSDKGSSEYRSRCSFHGKCYSLSYKFFLTLPCFR